MFDVTEIREITQIGEKHMTRFRKLSAKDPKSDPWVGDLTRPEKFAEWLWAKRYELETAHPSI